jgi:selenide,water dikinase
VHPWVDDAVGPLDDAALVRPLVGSATVAERTGPRLVMTVDVVTPMVDDPRRFGAIAAANALSDVYAMGGVPQIALSLVGFPSSALELSVLGEIFAGLREACDEAGCAVVGGHTLVDPEPKAGLSVTGLVEAERAWTHRGGRAGQALVLTKALGTGVIVQAMKDLAAPAEAESAAVASMRRLNARARALGIAAHATAATDVTGFGLLGHLRNLVEASELSAELDARSIPVLPEVRALVESGRVPGGTKRNLDWVRELARFADDVDETSRLVLADAQTSGGLLLAVPDTRADTLVAQLIDEGHEAARIGTLIERGQGPSTIRVTGSIR